MVKQTLRLATWNIHQGIGRDRRRDLARTAQVINAMHPDLIGLQEVDNRVEAGKSDLARLEELTGLRAIAGPTMLRPTGDYGNALLTRLAVHKVERHDISVKNREPRGILVAHLDVTGIRLQVAVTHLGLRPGERRSQVQRLIQVLSGENRRPMILMGDFNEWLFWGRPLRWLHHHFGHSRSPATFPARWPLLRLDHILSDPPEHLHSHRVFKNALARIASDHLPLVAIYEC
jgi:endonuclease/exonuclease/phosphatase family metal-dependent hydrolase